MRSKNLLVRRCEAGKLLYIVLCRRKRLRLCRREHVFFELICAFYPAERQLPVLWQYLRNSLPLAHTHLHTHQAPRIVHTQISNLRRQRRQRLRVKQFAEHLISADFTRVGFLKCNCYFDLTHTQHCVGTTVYNTYLSHERSQDTQTRPSDIPTFETRRPKHLPLSQILINKLYHFLKLLSFDRT